MTNDAGSPSIAPAEMSFRVLIVDDDDSLRDTLSALLTELGFDVVGSASDGAAGVASAAELRPEVVLMDMRMPGMTGVEAADQIKARDPLVQVVVFTAYDDPGLRDAAESAGVTSFLVKGCRPSIVADVLRSAGAHHRGLLQRRTTDELEQVDPSR